MSGAARIARIARIARTSVLAVGVACAFVTVDGCSSSTSTPEPSTYSGDSGDTGTPSPVTDDGGSQADGAECTQPATKPATGETCTGFGEGAPCGTCGLPAYGYVCVGGGPPGFTACVQASTSTFGDTYCCPKNDCVAQPDLDAMCASSPTKPHRFQCPPSGAGGAVAPSAGCTASGSGGGLEKFYCCP